MTEDCIELAKNVRNPCKISFRNLEYEVEIKHDKKEVKATGQKSHRQKIIKNVSGVALPGQTLFIMGASGAGKTSLLNILSDRISLKNGATLSGEIKINDTMKYDNEVFGKVSGYVMQDDILFSHFTPREALEFAANLKLGKISEEEKKSRIDKLIE